jgi:hypothetical protein
MGSPTHIGVGLKNLFLGTKRELLWLFYKMPIAGLVSAAPNAPPIGRGWRYSFLASSLFAIR